jgi:hypothetical protein
MNPQTEQKTFVFSGTRRRLDIIVAVVQRLLERVNSCHRSRRKRTSYQCIESMPE